MADGRDRLRARWRRLLEGGSAGDPDRRPHGSLPERGSDRYLGGVASGIARTLDVDPLVMRIGLALAAVYFPLVAVLYTIAWLTLRDERTHQSLLAGLRRPDAWRPVVGVSALGIGAALLIPDLGPDGDGGVKLGLVLFAVGLLLVTTRSRQTPDDEPAGEEDHEAADDADVSPPPPAGPPLVSWPPRLRRPRRPPSYLGWFGLSALILLVGILAAVDQAWEPVKPGVAVSLALLLVGSVLLLAAWRGRARILLPAGVVLLPLWAGFAVTDVPRFETDGDRTYRVGADDPFPAELTHGYGNMEVDLRDVDFARGEQRRLLLGMTAGRVQVDVPRNVHLRIEGDVGFGDVDVIDRWIVHDSGPLFYDGVDLVVGDPQDTCREMVTYPLGLYPGDPGYPEEQVEFEGEPVFPEDPRYPHPTTTLVEHIDDLTGRTCEPAEPLENPAELTLVLELGVGAVEVNRV